MSVLTPATVDHRRVDEPRSSNIPNLGLSERAEKMHQKLHPVRGHPPDQHPTSDPPQLYQPNYLLEHSMWNHLPRHFTVILNLRLPPRFYLCILFPTEEQLYFAACNLPWEIFGTIPASSLYPEVMKGSPEACACEITSFFVAATKKKSDSACVLKLKYCVAGNTSELRRVPVLAFRDNHYDCANTEQMREKVERVMEKYLFPGDRWTMRKTLWMLAYDTVFEEDGGLAPDLCPGYVISFCIIAFTY